ELGAKRVGGHGSVVGNDAHDEEVAGPIVAERSADLWHARVESELALAELVRVEDGQDRGDERVCKYCFPHGTRQLVSIFGGRRKPLTLDVRSGALAAGRALGRHGQASFDILLDLEVVVGKGQRRWMEWGEARELGRYRPTLVTLVPARKKAHRRT